MASIVVEDVCQVTFDRALRGYRTQHVDSFLAELSFARRVGTEVFELERMVRDREFPLAIGGYKCGEVDALIESATAGWRAHAEARALRDEALALKAVLQEVLDVVVAAIDQASRRLESAAPPRQTDLPTQLK